MALFVVMCVLILLAEGGVVLRKLMKSSLMHVFCFVAICGLIAIFIEFSL